MALAPDDIKVVSLDKLDDLFRLDVIDEETKVWRPGMAEWMPLGVVAGIEPDPPSSGRVQAASSARGPGLAAAPAPWAVPPTPTAPAVLSMTSLSLMGGAPVGGAPLNGARTAVLEPPVSSRPAPTPPVSSVRPAPTPPVAPVRPAPTPPVAPVRPAPAAIAVPRPAPAAALPGLPLRDLADPYGIAPRGRGTGRAQRVMVALSVAAGLMVTLYRNDILREAARSAGREGEYQQIETALGGPGFGTLRSLEKLGLPAGSAR